MVEQYFRRRGLDPNEHCLKDAAGYGWWITEGSAKIYVFIQDSPHGAVLRITSPLVFLPQDNRESCYRKLLDLNSNLSSCALSTHDDIVLVVAQRPREACEQLLALLRGGATPGSVDTVVADLTEPGEPMHGFRER